MKSHRHFEHFDHEVDKTAWGPGPWMDEPDAIAWIDEDTGYPCHVGRSSFTMGNLCGYVSVSMSHFDYGKDYDDVYVDVHGGLTYSGRPIAPKSWIMLGDCWEFGFDCAHLGDLVPGMEAFQRKLLHPKPRGVPSGEYRTVKYVQEECRRLAQQLLARQVLADLTAESEKLGLYDS